MENKEYILCAAVWYKDLPLIKPEILQPRGFRPYNIDGGVVMSGWGHMGSGFKWG
jgi:hypothetical protein